MYLASNVHITFPEFKGDKRTSPRKQVTFKSVNSFHIEKSWQHLTDTCRFIIAKKLYWEDKGQVFDLVKTGDPFYLEAGYNAKYYREFTGFVSEILDDLPVLFNCEDNMYVLKRTNVNKSFYGPMLETLLKAIVPPQFKIKAANVKLGDFVFKQYTVAKVLQELKDNYGLYSYFVDDTLVCGLIYGDNPRNQTVKYQFTKNIIDNDLKYRRKEDFLMKVTIRSHLSNGKVLKETVGDPEGAESSLVVNGITDRDTLKKLAQKELDRLRFDGYRGTLTGFGIPFTDHGYTANVVDLSNEFHNGNYYIDAVTVTFNDRGAIRRINRLGPKAA